MGFMLHSLLHTSHYFPLPKFLLLPLPSLLQEQRRHGVGKQKSGGTGTTPQYPFLPEPEIREGLTYHVLCFEFMFGKEESPEFPGQFEGGEDGVLGGEGDEGWTGEGTV